MKHETEVSLPVLEIEQPIGRFYIGVMKAKDLLAVSYADIRKIESELDQYIGIQRKLNKDRVRDIAEFVKSIDATFPTSVVLAVRGDCVEKDDKSGKLRIFEGTDQETGKLIPLNETASILDGQHRVEGLKAADKLDFNVPVSVFVDADIADQAYIFATVNLAQTKVNKSLVYDLLDYEKARSPQKSAHDITVAFDKFRDSPFHNLIKRLGARTPGRSGETLAQATVVNGIIPLISTKPEQDRYSLAKGKRVRADDSRYEETPLRHLWVEEKDAELAQILINYFHAAKNTWPTAWQSRETGYILCRTNGFRALIRLFKNIYLIERPKADFANPVISQETYKRYFGRSALKDADFTTANFPPGTSGETALYRRLRDELRI